MIGNLKRAVVKLAKKRGLICARDAVFCLLSALSFHEITTQLPRGVWIARPRGRWMPRMEYPPLNLTVMDAGLHAHGVDEHRIHGLSVRVFRFIPLSGIQNM